MVPIFAVPRLGLSTHLLGITQGIFLMVIGLVWPRLPDSEAVYSNTSYAATNHYEKIRRASGGIAHVAERLAANGVETIGRPTTASGSSCRFETPDGNLVEVLEEYEATKTSESAAAAEAADS